MKHWTILWNDTKNVGKQRSCKPSEIDEASLYPKGDKLKNKEKLICLKKTRIHLIYLLWKLIQTYYFCFDLWRVVIETSMAD